MKALERKFLAPTFSRKKTSIQFLAYRGLFKRGHIFADPPGPGRCDGDGILGSTARTGQTCSATEDVLLSFFHHLGKCWQVP